IQYDTASRTLDGKYLYLAVNATISSPDETPFEVLISATNITDLNRSQVELQEADRRKDQFLTVLAHELLSPLAAIHSAAELLRTPVVGPEQGRQIGDVLCRQTDQLTRLLHDLLDVSRVGQGKMVLDASPVDLRAVVFQAIEVHREQANRKRQVLEVDVPAEPVVVHGDRARLVQCVSNLVHNAVKYTQAEGKILVRAARDGDTVGVVVRDNGSGIPPARLRDVFDMFSQVGCRPDQTGGGLGIGLNVVKRLVEMHGGKVDVHSEGAGRGSEFSIRLPCLTTPAVADAMFLASAAPVSRSVLVVDDNADVAEMMALLLESLGCSVRTALDGEAAIKAAEQDPPDAVLLDIGLPGMDGYEVAAALRSKGYLGRLIALTGFGRSEDRQSALAAGFDHHVVKPGDVNVLRELLR
ncbi:MAG: hybrid sensor histidine kinase/response regulator, partial [Burkholderiaceae bacterium]